VLTDPRNWNRKHGGELVRVEKAVAHDLLRFNILIAAGLVSKQPRQR
jgi:hypothetical protein